MMENFDPFPTFEFRADRTHDGLRLDRFLARCMAWRSRASIQKAIDAGRISLAGRPAKASRRVRPGDRVTVSAEPRELPPFDPASVPVDVLFEDEDIAVFSKPAGIVVHPTGTYLNNTFMHVMVHRYEGAKNSGGRPVLPCLAHRIDRNTSGVLLLSLDPAHRSSLQRQFERSEVSKAYFAVVHGQPEEDEFTVDLPIGLEKNSKIKIKRGIRHDIGSEARTHVTVLERFPCPGRPGGFSLVEARPVTGRTHQIRVHLSAVGHPIIADDLYAGESALSEDDLTSNGSSEPVIERQALHARRLTVRHPRTGLPHTFTAPLPEDMSRVLLLLQGE